MGYDADDSDALEGMANRDWTLEVGLATVVEGGWGSLALSATTDVLGEHDGQEVRLTYSIPLGSVRFQVQPAAGIAWYSENLADHYFGVRPGEARAGRPAYAVESATNVFVEVRVLMPLSRRWALVLSGGVEWLDDAITASPIVEDNTRFGMFAGASYMF
jgi:outer membrane protein